MGWNTQHTAAVHFDNCLVPIDNLVGNEGDGFKIAMAGLDGGRVNIAACSIGGARKALELAKSYSKERKQFGKQLADFQSIQFKLADMATELDASRLMLHRAAVVLMKGRRMLLCTVQWQKNGQQKRAQKFVMMRCKFMVATDT